EAPAIRQRRASRDGVWGPARTALLRSFGARLRDRHLRRTVPRTERRDPRDRAEPLPPLCRTEDLRFPFRLRRPGGAAWSRAARAHAGGRGAYSRARRF